MSVFVGLDVALNSVSICIVDESGAPVWQGKSPSEPPPLIAALLLHRENIVQVGIEACPLSEWLYGALRDAGFPVVCIETRHTQRFLSSRPNKTDRSDARGIAEMMRLGHYRAVHVKSLASQRIRTVLAARSRLVEQIIKIENTIRGLLKIYGLKVGSVHRCTFAARIEALLQRAPELRLGIDPLLEVRNVMRRQKVLLDRKLSLAARGDETCRRLMTIPGVGPIVSLAFKATIDDPSRFKNAKSVAAHLGLTPRIYQSGEIELVGNISKCGDMLMRHLLYEAANSHLRIAKKSSALKAWAMTLLPRIGAKKTCVAVARRLAIIMHRMWVDRTDFNAAPTETIAA